MIQNVFKCKKEEFICHNLITFVKFYDILFGYFASFHHFNLSSMFYIQCGLWHSVHIDDLYREEEGMPKMAQMIGRSVATLVTSAVCGGPSAKPLKDV